MKTENYSLKALNFLWNLVIVVLIAIVLFQTSNIKHRLSIIEKRGGYRVASANDISSNGSKLTSSGKYGTSLNRTWLHPKAKNQIHNVALFTPAPNSNYDTVIAESDYRVSEHGNYNLMVNLNGHIHEYFEYIGCKLIFRDFKDPQKLIGMLAERFEITNGGKDYTFYLKKGVKWHKPTVDLSNPKYAWLKGDHYVTTKDIKFTFDTLMNTQVEASDVRSFFEELDNVEIIDDYTFIIHWKKPLATNQAGLFDNLIIIYPEFIYAYDESGKKFPEESFGLKFNNHWYNDRMIGCGPYRLKEHKENQYVLLERNEDFFINEKPIPKEIKFVIVKDTNLQYLKLKGGELNVINRIPKTVYRDDIVNAGPNSPFKNGKLKYIPFNVMAHGYIGWNNENPIFSDWRTRRAMTHAIDREFYINNLLMGLGTLRTGPTLYIFKEHYETKPYEYNLKKAKELLAEAGWKDEDKDGILEKNIDGKPVEFEFNMLSTDSPLAKTFFSRVKEDMRKIGVKMNVTVVDGTVLYKKLEDRDFDAYVAAWGEDPVAHLHQLWHSSQINGSNYIAYQNKEVDNLIDQVRNMPDSPERVRLFKKANRIIHEEQPYTFLENRKDVVAYNSDLENISITVSNPQVIHFTTSQKK